MPPSGWNEPGPDSGTSATSSRAAEWDRKFRFGVVAVAVAVVSFVGALQAHNVWRGGEGCYWTNGKDRLQSTARWLSGIEGAAGVSLDDSNCRVGGRGIARIAFPGVSSDALVKKLGLERSCGAHSDHLCSVNGVRYSVAVLEGELRVTLDS
jgi:hypothetical protein